MLDEEKKWNFFTFSHFTTPPPKGFHSVSMHSPKFGPKTVLKNKHYATKYSHVNCKRRQHTLIGGIFMEPKTEVQRPGEWMPMIAFNCQSLPFHFHGSNFQLVPKNKTWKGFWELLGFTSWSSLFQRWTERLWSCLFNRNKLFSLKYPSRNLALGILGPQWLGVCVYRPKCVSGDFVWQSKSSSGTGSCCTECYSIEGEAQRGWPAWWSPQLSLGHTPLWELMHHSGKQYHRNP